jgi:hypothetical protein
MEPIHYPAKGSLINSLTGDQVRKFTFTKDSFFSTFKDILTCNVGAVDERETVEKVLKSEGSVGTCGKRLREGDIPDHAADKF